MKFARAAACLCFFSQVFLYSCGTELEPSAQVSSDQDPLKLKGEYLLYHRMFSLTHSFDLYANEKVIASVEQKIFAWGRSFIIYDANHQKIGEAKQKILSWGVEIECFDEGGVKIATIKEEIFRSLFKVNSHYLILNAQAEQIGSSEKSDWLSTNFAVKNMDNSVAVTMARPALRLRDYWKVTVSEGSTIDNRVVIFIAAYKSAVDADRRNKK